LDADDKPTALSITTRGAITALAFFYGHCVDPGGCPVAWSAFEALKKEAADDPLLRRRLRLVFVSLDPTHDTPAAMRVLQKSENADPAPPWRFLTSRSQNDLAPLLASMGQDIAFEADAGGKRTGVVYHMLKVSDRPRRMGAGNLHDSVSHLGKSPQRRAHARHGASRSKQSKRGEVTCVARHRGK